MSTPTDTTINPNNHHKKSGNTLVRVPAFLRNLHTLLEA